MNLIARFKLVALVPTARHNPVMTVVGKKVTKKLGKKIQRLRKEIGYTSQESFAEALGLSRTHIGHIEQGRKNPSMEVLVKIAKKLKVEVSELFEI